MIAIASADDPRIAEYQHIANADWLRTSGLFVAEGRLVVRRLLAGGRFRAQSVLVTAAAFSALSDVLEDTDAVVFVVDQNTMNGIVGFNIHRGCLGLAYRPPAQTVHDLPFETLRRVVVMEGINNPDNVGGIFRSAAALGVDAVVLGPSCSDPLYRKSVRTSMAAALELPFVDAGAWPDALDTLRAHGFRVLALTPSPDAMAIDVLPRSLDRLAILVGSEGAGLSDAALASTDDRVRIPMSGRGDSLNVTVATSIALYHVRGE